MLGHQPAGMYHSSEPGSRIGMEEMQVGEPVASAVYFYTLTCW